MHTSDRVADEEQLVHVHIVTEGTTSRSAPKPTQPLRGRSLLRKNDSVSLYEVAPAQG
jgi:hypothetical protein